MFQSILQIGRSEKGIHSSAETISSTVGNTTVVAEPDSNLKPAVAATLRFTRRRKKAVVAVSCF